MTTHEILLAAQAAKLPLALNQHLPPDIRVLVTWDGHVDEAPLSRLLPYGFGPASLHEKEEEE